MPATVTGDPPLWTTPEQAESQLGTRPGATPSDLAVPVARTGPTAVRAHQASQPHHAFRRAYQLIRIDLNARTPGCVDQGSALIHKHFAQGDLTVKDRRALLSTLWIFVIFNYIYADIFQLFFDPSLQKDKTARLAAGYVGSTHVTQGFALFAAVVLETAIAMVVLSRVLGYQANRWANMVVGVLQALTIALTLTGKGTDAFYVMFALIEIAGALFIAWYAWTWRPATSPPRSTSSTARTK